MSSFVDKVSSVAESFNPLPSGSSVIDGLTGKTGADASLAGAQLQYKATKEGRDQLERLNQPYLELGQRSIGSYENLLDPNARYSSVMSNPFLTGALDATARRVGAGAAAQGKLNSGGMTNALFGENFNLLNNLGQQELQNYYQPTVMGQNAANFQGTNSANLLGQGGNALAAGGVGAANAYSQGASNIAGIGGMLASLFSFSDERLKDDMTPIGKDENGLTVYSFRYKQPENPLLVGYSAQEVAEKDPENAIVDPESGYLKVSAKYKPERLA